jgi:hypothetical protein
MGFIVLHFLSLLQKAETLLSTNGLWSCRDTIKNFPAGLIANDDSTVVPASPLVNAWIGLTQAFGLNVDGPPPVYQKGEDLIAPTSPGHKAHRFPFFITTDHFLTTKELFQ